MDSVSFSNRPEWTAPISVRGQNGHATFSKGERKGHATFSKGPEWTVSLSVGARMDSATFSKGPEWTVSLSFIDKNGHCHFQSRTRTDCDTFSQRKERTVPPSVIEEKMDSATFSPKP